MMIFSRLYPRSAGSALISTMLVLTVLTIIVVAFLQSMTVEQKTARSYLMRCRADLAAKAAANESENLVRRLFTNYPDSCTAWATFSQTRGTVFYYRVLAGGDIGSDPKDSAIDIKGLPLISGATAQTLGNLTESTTFPGSFTAENSVDINRSNWVGTPAGATTPPLIRAQWKELLENPTSPRDDAYDPDKGRAKNGPIARYAFWIEDESFRVNVNSSGFKARNSDSKGLGPQEIDLEAVPEVAGTNDVASQIISLREALPDKKFLTASQIDYAGGNADNYAKLKYYLTESSAALNFSRGGVKRLDLNQAISDTTSPTEIESQIARIIAAVGNKYAMPDIAPAKQSKSDFGQRFYHTGELPAALNANGQVKVTSTFNYPDVYMEKLAANIRDYIDTDSQPTIIEKDPSDPNHYAAREAGKPDATSMIGFTPSGNGGSYSDTVAVGKEAVPALQEYVLRARLNSMSPPKKSAGNTSANYDMVESHYFEFMNPTNKPILVADLGSAPFLMIANQVSYDTAGGDNIPDGRVIEIPLNKFQDGNGTPLTEFPAGKTTVLTTDDDPEPQLASGVNVSTFYRPDPGTLASLDTKRHFKGVTKSASSSPSMFRLFAQLGSAAGRGGSSSSDYDTHMLLGNDVGVLESFTALPIPGALSVKYLDNATSPPDPHSKFYFGGSLKGNNGGNALAESGDARSLNEQLFIKRYASGSPSDITRFLSNGVDSDPTKSNLGAFVNNSFVDARQWPDYAPQLVNGAGTAFARIINANLDSVGQLGDIYDPSREADASGIDYARGGGRTLRIGQSERYVNSSGTSPGANNFGLWDGVQTSVSRNRAAWRLADVFATNHAMETPGLININGVSRDNGAALKAAIYKLQFGTATPDAATLNGKSLDVDSFLTAVKERFPSLTKNDPSTDNPFWERGEISEVQSGTDSIFSAGTKLSGVDMKATLDRGREELVRRIIELIATKGNVYSAYCVGEAVAPEPGGRVQVLARQQVKVTFAIEPVFETPLPADNLFDPVTELDQSSPDSSKRFRRPERYQVKILSVNTI